MDDSSISDYEKVRQENIKRNQELLKSLQLQSNIFKPVKTSSSRPSSTKSSSTSSVPKFRKKRKFEEEELTPRRTSSRLRGIPIDPNSAELKEDIDRQISNPVIKRERVEGNVQLEGIKLGRVNNVFTDEDVKNTTDKDLKAVREKLMGLELQEICGSVQVKVVPERVYSIIFHPTVEKKLIFAADKYGSMSYFDASSNTVDENKEESPNVTEANFHTGAVSAMVWDNGGHNLYTCSHDGTIRSFDIAKGLASEVYASKDRDLKLSSADIADDKILYFTTDNGCLGRRDLRTKKTDIWNLTDKKIGNVSVHPKASHLVATASLDRTMKIWDLRKMVFEGLSSTPSLSSYAESRLSFSAANWNANGSIVTTSYDNTVRVYKLPDASGWKPGHEGGLIEADHTIGHNNQTGRWVSILKAHWQKYPSTGQKFCVGNMDKALDIFSEDGEQLAQLWGEGMTAVPAVCQFHPTMDWVVGGNASGKVVLFF